MRILKISTLPSKKEAPWQDRDHIMLHACFQLLVDCVENENLFLAWSHEKYKVDIGEIKRLYNWWKNLEDFCEDVEIQANLESLIKLRDYLWT